MKTVLDWARVAVLLIGAAMTSCIVNPQPDGVYQTCSGSCVLGTTCLQANASTDGYSGTFCTAICDVTNPACPDDGTGIPAVCVSTDGSGTGLCYAGCPYNTGCPWDETCGNLQGVNICIP